VAERNYRYYYAFLVSVCSFQIICLVTSCVAIAQNMDSVYYIVGSSVLLLLVCVTSLSTFALLALHSYLVSQNMTTYEMTRADDEKGYQWAGMNAILDVLIGPRGPSIVRENVRQSMSKARSYVPSAGVSIEEVSPGQYSERYGGTNARALDASGSNARAFWQWLVWCETGVLVCACAFACTTMTMAPARTTQMRFEAAPMVPLLARSLHGAAAALYVPALFDVDCNLHLLGEHATSLMAAARDRGVRAIFVPGSSIADSAKPLANSIAEVRAFRGAGVHPFEARCAPTPHELASLEALLDTKQYVACGECGLDSSDGFPPMDAQRAWFKAQVAMAKARELPLFAHERGAHDEFMRLLDPGLKRVMVHWCALPCRFFIF